MPERLLFAILLAGCPDFAATGAVSATPGIAGQSRSYQSLKVQMHQNNAKLNTPLKVG
ncbi:MAG: hypothetical protein ACOYNF_03505 [Rhodoferax sp.]